MSAPYFIPWIGIKQLPSPPFNKASSADPKCLGYDSDGRGFDANVFLKPGNSQLVVFPSANQGTSFKDMATYTNACSYVGGQMVGQQCQLSQDQAMAAVAKHGSPTALAAINKFSGDMSDYDHSFVVQMLKSFVLIGVLIFLIRTINRMK